MARYIARIETPRSPEDAFAFMADLRAFAEWDPGVVASEQVEGDGPGLGAVYDLTVRTAGWNSTLRYETTEYVAPHRYTVVGANRLLTSIDTITVEATRDGSHVTYDAELKLILAMRGLDPLLRLAFNRIGDRAAAGMAQALQGRLRPA